MIRFVGPDGTLFKPSATCARCGGTGRVHCTAVAAMMLGLPKLSDDGYLCPCVRRAEPEQ